MAAVKFKEGTLEWQMFVDFWALCQRHWEIEDTDEYWSNLVDDISKFTEKYNNNTFARGLALAFSYSQEEKFKKSKE